MKKLLLTLFTLSMLTSCNDSDLEEDTISTAYYFNFTYDSVNVFSYENYHLDSLSVLVSYDHGGSYFSNQILDSIFYEEAAYEMNGSFLVDYGNGDIDTVVSRWNDHEFNIFFNDRLVFSAESNSDEWDFVQANKNAPASNWPFRTDTSPIIFQCEKKSLIPAEN
jgi:hypothetical protein